MSRIAPLVAWIALGCFTTLWAEVQDYEIVLHRPTKVGQVTRTHIEFSEEHSNPSNPGLSDSEDPMKADLDVLLTIVEIDDAGKPTELKMEVKSSNCLVHGKTSPLYEVGDVIRIKGQGTILYVNEKAAALEQRLLLMHLCPIWLEQFPSVTDQSLYQPDHRVKIGESWTFECAVKRTRQSQQGTVKLEDVQIKEGVSYLRVTSNTQIQGSGFPPPRPDPLPSFHGQYTLTVKIDSELPLDSSLPIRSRTVERLLEPIHDDASSKAMNQDQTVTFKRLKVENSPVQKN